jgi:eukaryotic-like serine/threonine-protein kinase
MPLSPGTKFGAYEVVCLLGAGGMGEVYRARDTRLGREVAIKILPKEMSADTVRKQRFEREAKTISSLNHPNICVLHDVGSQDGVEYLVMECVEGETLAKRLERGALPLEQVLKFGAQIADALDKAHRGGVVHRDLKPGNVMLTASGAKLLDFGLARPVASAATLATTTVSAPQQSPVTQEGTLVGTFQYMSPEQVEGKEVDGRSDIFSLGTVLYEMVTGKRAFDGKSQLSVASAILEMEPEPLGMAKPMTPPALDHAVKKCLAKAPDERWQSASDLASELKWVGEGGNQSGSTASTSVGRFGARLAWAVAAASSLALIVVAIWLLNSKRQEQTMYFPAPMRFPGRDITISPNGHSIAFVAYLESARKNVIWIYELGSPDAKSLPDTEGATYPFWSADGRSLAFFAEGKLKKMDMPGGPVQTLCDAPSGRGGTWNKDGVILFTPEATLGPGRGLYRVPSSGGTPIQVTDPDTRRGEQSHRWPVFLPDGKHFLYMAANFSGQKGVRAIFVGSLDSKEKRFVMEAKANAVYAAPGYLLFPSEKALLAQRFDPNHFTLIGEPTPIVMDIKYQPLVRKAEFAVSDNGLLVAQTGSAVALSQPVWFDRKGNAVGAVGKPDMFQNLFIAPNGRSVALDITDQASENLNSDIWTYDLQRETAKRLTFPPSTQVVPIWSPDSSRLVFASNRGMNFNLYMKISDGSQEEKNIEPENVEQVPNDWSKDGKYILFTHGRDLWFLTFPELKGNQFLKAPGVLRNGQFSPDGRWVAYASNETGKWEIYVTSFPAAQGKWQISAGGGEQPRWRGDGKEVFYLSADRKMMAAPVTTGATFDAGVPVALFQATPRQAISTNDQFVYDVSRDGQRFLINTPVKQADTQPMSIILNWTAKLSK